jgi:hypothetical protein
MLINHILVNYSEIPGMVGKRFNQDNTIIQLWLVDVLAVNMFNIVDGDFCLFVERFIDIKTFLIQTMNTHIVEEIGSSFVDSFEIQNDPLLVK